jgi:hypothetical protein
MGICPTSTALIKIYDQPLKTRQLCFFGARRAGRYNLHMYEAVLRTNGVLTKIDRFSYKTTLSPTVEPRMTPNNQPQPQHFDPWKSRVNSNVQDNCATNSESIV